MINRTRNVLTAIVLVNKFSVFELFAHEIQLDVCSRPFDIGLRGNNSLQARYLFYFAMNIPRFRIKFHELADINGSSIEYAFPTIYSNQIELLFRSLFTTRSWEI